MVVAKRDRELRYLAQELALMLPKDPSEAQTVMGYMAEVAAFLEGESLASRALRLNPGQGFREAGGVVRPFPVVDPIQRRSDPAA
jgi:hypothetical protein